MVQKLLIANRGEIACRIIRAARKLSLPTVAVYSAADSALPHVAQADESVLLGPAPARESYLNQEAVIEAARRTGATLVHPGYGFLSERASFAQSCASAGLTFVGPSADVIRLMGDKNSAREAAARARVPVLPGSGKLDISDAGAIAASGAAVGFPLLVKAAAGGGGIGMRIVQAPSDLAGSVAATSSMAAKAFGDGAVYLERYVPRARHVEVQVFGFGDGTSVHLYERDCSLQRRHQKVIEEARAPDIAQDVLRGMCAAAVDLVNHCRYKGAGTIEFLYDTQSRSFYFLEMNTRIQVEHPVTEMITGIDLVGCQLRLAMGDALADTLVQSEIKASGHAVEARVYAEDPGRNFIPRPGRISKLAVPAMDAVRVETGYQTGSEITPFYDPMVMKVIAWGSDRAMAVDRLRRALAATELAGIDSNLAYLRAILEQSDFLAGRVHTNLLLEQHQDLISRSQKPAA